MEGDTLLTQYYVPQWSLKYVNESKCNYLLPIFATTFITHKLPIFNNYNPPPLGEPRTCNIQIR